MKSNLLSNIFCAWIISQGMFEIMDYGKLWAVRLWEGMRPLMGGCDTLRAFSGPGHPPGQPLGNRITPLNHLGVLAYSRRCAITELRDYHFILHSCLKTFCPLPNSL